MSTPCEICGKPVEGYEPQFESVSDYCPPVPSGDPCVCSDRCYMAIMSHIGTSFEERRIRAGIEKWRSTNE